MQYELHIYQHDIPVGVGSIPGTKEIRGWVTPFCGGFREILVLEMQDGATVSFFFADSVGSILSTGGITQAASR